MKRLIIHLVSESSGQTVKQASNTALTKFSNIEVKKYHWPMIRNTKLMEEVFKKIKLKPGVVLYTISNEKLRKSLKVFCKDLDLPCISIVSHVIREISDYIGIPADEEVDYYKRFNEKYFDKVEAIEYTLKHDDGQNIDELKDADIILIGPSRTSKTPTSVYLAYNGYRTANVPLVYGCEFPKDLEKLKNPIIFGLVINPSRLIKIRENRMNFLNVKNNSQYVDIDIIKKECIEIKKLCLKNNWYIIDVSMKSIEETAAMIMKFCYEHKKKILNG